MFIRDLILFLQQFGRNRILKVFRIRRRLKDAPKKNINIMYKRFLFWLVLVMLPFVFWMCSGQSRVRESFEPGKIITDVKCTADTSFSYTLFLPASYDPDNTYPLIYIFDAHAKGEASVRLFRDMADKYGYILIGSNDSRNGLSMESQMHIYEVISSDVLGRFSVDRNRIYTAGFSGGSRVASSIAIYKGGIAGVIGCSAGFPAVTEPIQFHFDYIGFVGNEDMNYLEMIMLQEALQAAGYRHHLIVFTGTHEWPSPAVLGGAFTWMEVNAMRDMKKARDDEFIANSIHALDLEARQLEKSGQLGPAYEVYGRIVVYFDGLTDVSVYKAKLKELMKREEIHRFLGEKSLNREKEMSLQTQYLKALTEKPLPWWKPAVVDLNALALEGSAEDRAIYKRLLAYLSLAAYSNANGHLMAGHYDEAARFINLYAVIDPQNSEHAYLAACMYAQTQRIDPAFASLEKAVSLGFDDAGRYTSDTLLNALKSDPRYEELRQKMQKKIIK